MDRIEKCVELFLTRNFSFKRPLLFALSGGVDSSVLCSILIDIKRKRDFDLQILHIDHSWRADSRDQAQNLQKKCEKMKIPFTLFTLDPPTQGGNLEEIAREARLHIFQKVAKEQGAEGLMLGHHRDDLAETMLKRIFESTPFPFWSAIEEVSTFNELPLWRPLLRISKKEIMGYAKENEIEFLIDSTQDDPRFLRNRMRMNLIPELERSFGKALGGPLAELREQSKKLHGYLAQKIEPLANIIKEDDQGLVLDLKELPTTFVAYEIEFFLTSLCRKGMVSLSLSQKEKIAELLCRGDQEGEFTTSSLAVRVRGKKAHFQFISTPIPALIEKITQKTAS